MISPYTEHFYVLFMKNQKHDDKKYKSRGYFGFFLFFVVYLATYFYLDKYPIKDPHLKRIIHNPIFDFPYSRLKKFIPYLDSTYQEVKFLMLYKFNTTKNIFIKYRYFTLIGIGLLIALVLYRSYLSYLERKEQEIREMKKRKIQSLLKKLNLVYSESTKDIILDSNGEKQFDDFGRVLYRQIEHFPEFDFSGLPNSFLIKNIHPRIESSFFDYILGLLYELEVNNYIEANQGEVSKTGYPRELKVSLYSQEKLKELDLYRNIGWSEQKSVNNVKTELFPKITISEVEVIVDFSGIGVTEKIIRSGLEQFGKFHSIKLKDRFKWEGHIYFFSYQTKLDRVFSKGEDILSKFKSSLSDLEKNYLEGVLHDESYAEEAFIVASFFVGPDRLKSLFAKVIINNPECDISTKRKLYKILIREFVGVDDLNEFVDLVKLIDDNPIRINRDELVSLVNTRVQASNAANIKKSLDSDIYRYISLFSKVKIAAAKSGGSSDDKIIEVNTQLLTEFKNKQNDKIIAFIEKGEENLYEEKIIKKMRDHYERTGKELAFLGELDDPNITLKDNVTQIFIELASGPHCLVAGQTRSGKTKSILSFVFNQKLAYPKSEWIFADGKGSLDYDVFAERFSNYPVAKMGTEDDPLIELANQVFRVYEINEQRKIKMAKLAAKGVSASTYVEYNRYVSEEERIHRLYFIIDEFKLFVGAANSKVNDLISEKGTIWQMLDFLLREAASKGISLYAGSQRLQASDIPAELRSNFQTVSMIHNVGSRDAAVLGLAGQVETLETGSYMLTATGVWCLDTGVNTFKCNMPYIGDEPHHLLNKFFPEKKEHEPFDYDLIYNKGKSADLSKINNEGFAKYVKQVFLVREGFEVIEEFPASFNFVSFLTKLEIEDRIYKVAIGIISAEELSDADFYRKLREERKFNFHEYFYVFFVRGSKLSKTQIDAREESLANTALFVDVDFDRPLLRAIHCYKKNDTTPIFKKMVEAKLESVFVSDDLSVVKDERDEINETLSIKEFERIIKIKDNNAKGDMFEDFCLTLEKHYGHDTVHSEEIVKEGLLKGVHVSSKQESGLDLLRWTNRREKRAVIIQCKNVPSRRLGPEVIDKLTKTKSLYEKSNLLRIEGMILYCSGKITRQAQKEAQMLGVAVIDNKEILKQLEIIEDERFSEEIDDLIDE